MVPPKKVKFATRKQFDLLKKFKKAGTLQEKTLTSDVRLTNRQARELGFDAIEGEDFLLSPTLEGRVPLPRLRPPTPPGLGVPEPVAPLPTQAIPSEPFVPPPPEGLEPEPSVERPDFDELIALAETPEEVEFIQTLQVVDNVFPDISLEELGARAEADPDRLLEDIVAQGRNENTVSLLRLLRLESREIDALFDFSDIPTGGQPFFFDRDMGGVPVRTPGTLTPDGLVKFKDEIVGIVNLNTGQLVTLEEIRKLSAPTDEEVRTTLKGGGVSEVEIEKIIELSHLDLTKDGWVDKFKEINPSFRKNFFYSVGGRSIASGIGGIISAAAGIAGWASQDKMRGNLVDIAEVLQSPAPERVSWTGIETLIDPRFWQTTVLETMTFSVALLPASVAAAYAAVPVAGALGIGATGTTILTVIFGAAGGGLVESAFESGSVWNEAKALGFTDEEADKAASSVYWKNAATLAAMRIPEFAFAFGVNPFGATLRRMASNGLVRVSRIGVPALTEGGQEFLQDLYTRQALGQPIVWDDEAKLAVVLGAILGVGVGAGGNVFTTIQERTKSRYTPEMQEIYDAEFRSQVENDIAAEIADLQGQDKVAETEEGKKLVEDVSMEVRQEELEKVITSEDKVENLAIQHALDAQREGIPTVEPTVVPTAPLTEALVTDAERVVSQAEAIDPDNPAVQEMRGLVDEAKVQTGDAQRQTLIKIETLEDKVKGIPGITPEVAPTPTTEPVVGAEAVEGVPTIGVIPETAIAKPVETLPDLTPVEEVESRELTGKPQMNLAQIDVLNSVFANYLNQPSVETAFELTRELRREARAGRAENLKNRTQQLIVEEGLSTEDAINQARRETMSGRLPSVTTEYLEGLTTDMRDSLYAKVYHVLRNEPFELMSTSEALTNALMGKPIPREPGARGGSAFSRLQRVFGDQPQLLAGIDKAAKENKSLGDIIEGIFHEVGRPPVPIDQTTADYLRNLMGNPTGQAFLSRDVPTLTKLTESKTSEQIRMETDELKIELAPPPVPVVRYEFPIEQVVKETSLWPSPVRDNVIKVLKEVGWLPVDIGNFLRANKTSFDFSFWRQQGTLMFNHPVTFIQANIEAWKAIWSQKSAEASWQKISRDPLFELYSVAENAGFDFLRPAETKLGTAQWSGTEEFGYLTGERLIPRLTSKIPWVKISARSFVTGTNSHNWRIFKNYYDATLKINEKYGSGELTLKEGEIFSIEKEMVDMARLLADMTQRASLGGARGSGLVTAINSLMFAPRATLGKILTPRHLLSSNPRIRIEAWRNIGLFVGIWSSILLLGKQMDLWDVELDPRSAEFMSIRVGNTRIDPWAGHRQLFVFYVRVLTDMFTNKKGGVSSVTGAEYEIDPIRALASFARGKASPLASILLDFWTGRTFIGDTVDVTNKRQWAERIAAFSIWDIYEAVTENNAETGAGVTIPAILGFGVQTYTGEWVENFPKLGLPKYEENLPYGINNPKYTTSDFWSDHSAQFTGVDPVTLTDEKGFPNYIRSMVEAKVILKELDDIPNVRLIDINADPSEGTTFGQYRKMWEDREKIVASGDEKALKEFDGRNKNAELGNISQQQFALLVEYHSILDKGKQAEFFEEHKDELGNPRLRRIEGNAKENALLAMWGRTKVLSKQAFDGMKALAQSLDIPDNAIPPQNLPPDSSVEAYFKYQDIQGEFTGGSLEARLHRVQNPEFDEWGREVFGWQRIIDTEEEVTAKIKKRDRVPTEEIEEPPEVVPEPPEEVIVEEPLEPEVEPEVEPELPEVEQKYQEYLTIENNQAARDQFRIDNPDLDEWGVEQGIWVRTMTERRRRAGRTPGERTQEGVEEIIERITDIEPVVPLR